MPTTSSSSSRWRGTSASTSRRPGPSCRKPCATCCCGAAATSTIEFRYFDATGARDPAQRTPGKGILPNLERRYRETESSDRARGARASYRGTRACVDCRGSRLNHAARNVFVAGRTRCRSSRALSIADARRFFASLQLDGWRGEIAPRLVREIADRLTFLSDVGLDYLVARPQRGDAVRRRGAAHPAREPDRLGSRGRDVHPRRAVDRAAPARQPAAARHADAAARPRQHRAGRRARRGGDSPGRLRRRPGPGRRRARRARRRAGHAGRGRGRSRVADRPVPERTPAHRRAAAARACARRPCNCSIVGATRQQPARIASRASRSA